MSKEGGREGKLSYLCETEITKKKNNLPETLLLFNDLVIATFTISCYGHCKNRRPPMIRVNKMGSMGSVEPILTEFAHWADSVSKSRCPSECLFVSLCHFPRVLLSYYYHLQRSKVQSNHCKKIS